MNHRNPSPVGELIFTSYFYYYVVGSSHNKQKSPNNLERRIFLFSLARMQLVRYRPRDDTLCITLSLLMFIGLTLSANIATATAAAFTARGATSQYLHLTALVSGRDGRATFECWEIASPFSRYPTVGEAIPGLADVSNVSYIVLPPRSNEGFHRPPHPMSVLMITT